MTGFTLSRGNSRISIALLLVLGTLLAAAFSASATHASTSPFRGSFAYPNAVAVQEGPISKSAPDGTTFACQTAVAPKLHCYNPQQIRNAYDISPLIKAGITGKGKTIVIVDSYQSPTITADLKLFDQVFGLPNPTLNIIAPNGLTPFDYNDPVQLGWAGEITLDVEWSHAIAPGATIDLVLAKTSNDPDILSATNYAVQHNLGDVISQSFGEGEACSGVPLSAQHEVFEQAVDKHTTIFASSGDDGAAQASQTTPPACGGSEPYYLSASTPATDPLVTGVGATHLNAAADGSYINESAWNDVYGASGGGYSTVYARPDFQQHLVNSKLRGVPDVSYNGDVNGGVLTVWSSYAAASPPEVYIFGGTSAGSPQWAAIAALGDQLAGRRLGDINHSLYQIGANPAEYAFTFHDITSGNNTYTATDENGNPIQTVQGYNTTKGWDAVTGLGTPNVAHLLPILVAKLYQQGW